MSKITATPRTQKGLTTIEYVMLAAAVAALIAALVGFLDDGLTAAFKALCNKIGGTGTCT